MADLSTDGLSEEEVMWHASGLGSRPPPDERTRGVADGAAEPLEGVDFREGGTEKSRFRHLKGEEIFGEKTIFGNETVFNEIVPNERIIFTYSMDRNGVRFSVSLASVELSAAGAGTRMVFTEHAAFFEGGDGAQMREAGWRELSDKLDQYLTKGAVS